MIKYTKEVVESLEYIDTFLKEVLDSKNERELFHLFILNIEQLRDKFIGKSKTIKMWNRINYFVDDFIPKWQEASISKLDAWIHRAYMDMIDVTTARLDDWIHKTYMDMIEDLDKVNNELLKIELIKYEVYGDEKELYDIVFSNRMKKELTQEFREAYIENIKKWLAKTLEEEIKKNKLTKNLNYEVYEEIKDFDQTKNNEWKEEQQKWLKKTLKKESRLEKR
jgi:hypothetical protein